jgi:hypothetical protein
MSSKPLFETPMRLELGALTKSGKALWVRSFYNMIIMLIIFNPQEAKKFVVSV